MVKILKYLTPSLLHYSNKLKGSQLNVTVVSSDPPMTLKQGSIILKHLCIKWQPTPTDINIYTSEYQCGGE